MSEDLLRQIRATMRLLEEEIPEDETIKRENPEAPQENEPAERAEDKLQTAEVPQTKNLKSILRRLKDEIEELETEVLAQDLEEKVKRLRSLLRSKDEEVTDVEEEIDEKALRANPDADILEKIKAKLAHKRLRDEDVEDEDVDVEDEEDVGTKKLRSSSDQVAKAIEDLLAKKKALRDDEPVEVEDEDVSEEEDVETKRILRRIAKRLRGEGAEEDTDEMETKKILRRIKQLRDEEVPETEEDEGDVLKRILKRLREEEVDVDVEDEEVPEDLPMEESRALKALLKRTRVRRKKK